MVEENLLTKIILNGTELVITDVNAEDVAGQALTGTRTNADNITALTTRVTNLETAIAQIKN